VYEEQLLIQLPVKLLAVLDKESWEKFSPGSLYPFLPFNEHGAIFINANVEELPALRPTVLPGEFILFHELGHILAEELKIESPSFTSEFFANIFSAAYILAKRPDLKFVLDGPPPEKWPRPPRYTSLADLGYLGPEPMGQANYVWFENHLERVAGLFMKDQKLRDIVRGLQ
jgi:hypothetical protein